MRTKEQNKFRVKAALVWFLIIVICSLSLSGCYTYAHNHPYEHQYIGATIYPTPSGTYEDVSIDSIRFTSNKVLIVVLNPVGEVFFEKTIISKVGDIIIVTNSKLTPGSYIVIGSENQDLYRKKLIIE